MSDFKPRDWVVSGRGRVAHQVREVNGNHIRSMCREVSFYDQPSSRGRIVLAQRADRRCVTCTKRGEAAERREAS